MIRSASVAVGPSPAQVAASCFGLVVWNESLPSTAFPLVATVDGSLSGEPLLLRPGVYYQFNDRAESVSVQTADGSAGTIAVDQARQPADFVNLSGVADPAVPPVWQSSGFAVGAKVLDEVLASFARPDSRYDAVLVIMWAGTLGGAKARYTAGGRTWVNNSATLPASLPGLVFRQTPRVETAAAQMGISATAGSLNGLGMPAVELFEVLASGAFVAAVAGEFTAVWWKA